MPVNGDEEKKRAEQERVMKIICRAKTREELLAALFARAEYLRRYPGDWCIQSRSRVKRIIW